MTLQALPGVMYWPGYRWSAPSFAASTVLNAAGRYFSGVHIAKEDMAISHVAFRGNAVAGSPTLDVRIETVDGSGIPSGTLWATNTNLVTGTLTTTWTAHALTATANISKGQAFAVRLLYNSGTSWTSRVISAFALGNSLPYIVTSTGSPVKAVGAENILYSLGSGATTWYNVRGAFPIITITNTTFNNTSGAARGMRFQVPFKCRATGIRFFASTSNGNYNALLTDDSGSELSSSSTAFDGDQNSNLTSGLTGAYFDNPVTLDPGTWYRALIQPSSATNCNMTRLTIPSNDYLAAMPGGVNCYATSLASGTFTDTDTECTLLDIIIDQLDDGKSPRASYQLGL